MSIVRGININTLNDTMREAHHSAGHVGENIIVCLVGSGVNKKGPLAKEGLLIAGSDQAFIDHRKHDTSMAYLYNLWLPGAKIIVYQAFPDGEPSVHAVKSAMRDILSRAKADRKHLYMVSMSLSGKDLKDDEIDSLGKQLTAAGAMVACSAGNTGADASDISYPAAYDWPYTCTNAKPSGTISATSSRLDTADFVDLGDKVTVMLASGQMGTMSGTSISVVHMWAKAGLMQCCYYDQTGRWWEDERLYTEMKAYALDLGSKDGWDPETGWGVVFSEPTVYETPVQEQTPEPEPVEKEEPMLKNNEFDFVVDAKLKWARQPGKLKRLDTIVIHHSSSDGSTIQSIHNYHLSEGHAGCDYNYVITADGAVYLGRGLLCEGGHVGNEKSNNLNEHSCGICLVGAIHKHAPTPAQVASAKKLIAAILALNGQMVSGVAINVKTIYGHREVPYYVNGKLTGDPYPTVCPGAYMPMAEFKALLSGDVAEDPAPAPEAGLPATFAYAGATGVNVRSGPSTAYAKLGKLTAGEQCIVLSRENGWAKIVLLNQVPVLVGYCIDTYLEEHDESDPVALYAYRGATYVNLREKPASSSKDIGDVNAGDEVLVLQLKDGWAEVIKVNDTPARRGWCIDTYLRRA
jgi:uncharacterized protein YgiM (DUF1202 family)